MDLLNVPKELRRIDQWVYNDNKLPVQLTGDNARSNTEEDWSSIKVLEKFRDKRFKDKNYGFSFALNYDYIGVDLDNAYDDSGEIKKWAYDIISNLRTAYIEKSMSGKGLHIFVKLKKQFKHKGKITINYKLGKYKETQKTSGCNLKDKDGIEIYYCNRFLAMTGNVVQNVKSIGDEGHQYIENLFKSLVDIQEANKNNKKSNSGGQHEDFKNIKSKVTIEEVLKLYGLDKTMEGGFTVCPFHDEQVKSLFIYPLTNSWFCFGCNQGGDIFSFIELKEKLTKKESLEFLSKTFKIPLEGTKDNKSSNIIEENNMLFLVNGDNLEQLTNFTIKIKSFIELEEFSLNCDIILNSGKVFKDCIFKQSDFENKGNFKKAVHKLTNLFGSYYEGDMVLEQLKDFIIKKAGNIETIKGLNHFGLIMDSSGKCFFIDQDSNIISQKDIDNSYVVVNRRNNINTQLKNIVDGVTLGDYTTLFKNILTINNKITMLTTMSYMAGCFFRSRLKNLKIKYPHFAMTAESATGKSTIKDFICMPFFGISSGESTASTRFPLNCALSSNNVIPLIVDEFKYSKMTAHEKKTWSEISRMSFDGLTYSRGKIDQSSDIFNYITGLMMFGENSFTDLADVNRCISVYTDRLNNLDEINESINYLLRSEHIINNLGSLLLKESLKFREEELKDLFVFNREKIVLNPRNIDNVACILLGLDLIESLFKNEFNFDIYSIIGKKELIIKGIESMQFEINQGGSNFTMSVIPKMLVEFDTMVSLGLIDLHDIGAKNNCISLYVKNIMPKYLQFRKNYNLQSEYIEEDYFTRQLRKSQYFLKYENAGFLKVNGIVKDAQKVQRKAFILNKKVLDDELMPNTVELLGLQV